MDCYLRFSLQYKFIVRPTVGTAIANLVTVGFSNIGFSLILLPDWKSLTSLYYRGVASLTLSGGMSRKKGGGLKVGFKKKILGVQEENREGG